MKHMKKFLALALVAMTILAVTIPAMAAYSTMYVNVGAGQTVRLRKTASTSGVILANIPHGTSVQAEYYNSTWHRVRYNGTNGFMMSKFLSDSNPSAPTVQPWETRYGTINYKNPSPKNELFKNVQADLNTFFKRNNLEGYAVYPLTIDGVMGNASEVAVMVFQQKALNDTDPDGIVGPIVKSNLYRIIHGQ
ncbi:MAG: hypothetical protein ACOX7B_09635 [Christensenellales bacterium]